MRRRAPTDIHLPLLDDRPREECGIVGICGIENASELAFLALYALQHRGQEAAGICAANNGRTRVYKELGLVSDVFDAKRIASLPGNTALGHVRYSTAGGGQRVNAQPIVVRYAEGDLAIVHNGNLTNARMVKRQLVREGAIFQSTSDSEVIVHLVARSRHRLVQAQLRDALSFLEGAYSLVLTVGETMYAVRDPRGFRPLVMGELDGGHIVTSETCALDLMGATYVRDIEPGELVRFRGGEVESLPGLHPQTPAPCIFELVYFARPDSNLWGISVDRARRAFGRQLAREHPVTADCVIAVPDSANSAALGYSEQSGIPYELGLLRNHYVGRTFIRPSQADRDFGARVKYNPVREVLEGQRVVVVDDSIVRGTTSTSLVKFIRGAGAAEVHFRVASPPVRYPCYYGIDMPSKEELMGSRRSVDDIAAAIGVDSLGYLSLDGMESAVAERAPFCTACFSGEYSAPLVDLDEQADNTKQIDIVL
ncbi:MAG: amidophosphoribosyltransferase [Gemmatimonadetes bacterium]|nr:amidophosphoribosyltransferase [Gemmatimonadota bacterium]